MLVYINTIGLLVLAVIQYLALRQIGSMLSRLGPLGARTVPEEGPRSGECVESQLRQMRSSPATASDGSLLLFVSSSCSVCREIRKSAALLANTWGKRVRIALCYDEEENSLSSPIDVSTTGSCEVHFGTRSFRSELNVPYVPFGVFVNSANIVVAKGLVNSTSHVESLLESGLR